MPMEILMLLRSWLGVGVAAATLWTVVNIAATAPSWAQGIAATAATPTPASPAPTSTAPQSPAAQSPAPQSPAAQSPAAQSPGSADETPPPKPGDSFGTAVALTAKPIIYIKGSGSWDNAFATISAALKKVEAYMAKTALKADGLPMTIFTATDDQGFEYEAAVPVAALPKESPGGDIAFGQSPEGRALQFVHRGPYDALDDTYEAITNYLDDKRLESQNILIEQYVTDPASADEKNMVINILVLIK